MNSDELTPIGSQQWTAYNTPSLLLDVNETFINLLVTVARRSEQMPGPFFERLRDPLRSAAGKAKLIAKRAPLLLLDINFDDIIWWNAVARDPASGVTDQSPLVPAQDAIELCRAALTLVWHLSRADLPGCLVLAGLSRPVAQTVGSLGLKQIHQIAECQYRSLRPRWEARPALWLGLLANTEGDVSARTFAIRALQISWDTARTGESR